MERKYDQILGIHITSTSIHRVLAFVRSSLIKKDKFYIVTPNPEIVLRAQKDKKLARILNNAPILIPDGVGLSQAAKFLSLRTINNRGFSAPLYFIQGIWVGLATFFDKKWLFEELEPIKGRDMFMELVRLANKKGWKVYLLGGEHGEGEETAKKLERSYKGVKFAWAQGPIFDEEGLAISIPAREEEKKVVESINNFRPDLLFVALEPPKQEKWIDKRLPELNIGGAMVVGGTFRYIAGQAKLPPKWMEGVGLEWAWRLLTEPWRLGRIINAAIVFPWRVFLFKLRNF